MRLPRDVSGTDLIKKLAKFGYQVTRQSGSHIRLTTTEPSQHHITIPAHDPLRIGTLNSILSEVAGHLAITKEELVDSLFR